MAVWESEYTRCWACGRLRTKMALDGDEVADDNDGDMLCIPTTLWVNADYRHCGRPPSQRRA